ncbi:hypothetical protein [Chryseobacterium luquanense]|uniref:DUF4825 domain-containing protein n=1 Tax=Chryseobacterium luquanense TaxID=2983766 RepID=A0ABT3Y6G0_9FLAO|nr:hypothetical protein [Chryseobacterium luquanense]MCX8533718.1 hypothetical protein [Chryseobacterium luquanense]
MKNLQLLFLCLFANILFGQTKFDNEKLTLVQDVYHNSTKNNLSSFMEKKGFKVGEMEKAEGQYGDAYNFSSQFNMVHVEYTPKGAMYGVTLLYAGAPNNIFIEMKLKDGGYTSKEHEMEIEGKKFIKKQWTKSGQKNSFVTYADSDEKIGFLGYGEFED